MSDFGLFLVVGVLIVLFWGKPDLHDSLMHYLDRANCGIPTTVSDKGEK